LVGIGRSSAWERYSGRNNMGLQKRELDGVTSLGET
jgi:hypothetical protein